MGKESFQKIFSGAMNHRDHHHAASSLSLLFVFDDQHRHQLHHCFLLSQLWRNIEKLKKLRVGDSCMGKCSAQNIIPPSSGQS